MSGQSLNSRKPQLMTSNGWKIEVEKRSKELDLLKEVHETMIKKILSDTLFQYLNENLPADITSIYTELGNLAGKDREALVKKVVEVFKQLVLLYIDSLWHTERDQLFTQTCKALREDEEGLIFQRLVNSYDPRSLVSQFAVQFDVNIERLLEAGRLEEERGEKRADERNARWQKVLSLHDAGQAATEGQRVVSPTAGARGHVPSISPEKNRHRASTAVSELPAAMDATPDVLPQHDKADSPEVDLYNVSSDEARSKGKEVKPRDSSGRYRSLSAKSASTTADNGSRPEEGERSRTGENVAPTSDRSRGGARGFLEPTIASRTRTSLRGRRSGLAATGTATQRIPARSRVSPALSPEQERDPRPAAFVINARPNNFLDINVGKVDDGYELLDASILHNKIKNTIKRKGLAARNTSLVVNQNHQTKCWWVQAITHGGNFYWPNMTNKCHAFAVTGRQCVYFIKEHIVRTKSPTPDEIQRQTKVHVRFNITAT
ncbi:MAG: hypothetical protein M1819_002403 [Sarea resinae]|nr:MAG: hypothetical protein M1819_002403 [Sarea resinae]